MYKVYLQKQEIIEIAISVTSISFALAIVFAGSDALFNQPIEFLVFLAPLFVTVGSGFILHEMAHKLVAIYYGAQARFRMWTQGIIFMLATSFFGVLFAAPGAVYIYASHITKRENGIISLAGPTLNVVLIFFFIALEFIAPVQQYYTFLAGLPAGFAGFGMSNGVIHVWRFGAAMNLILALFNMIPAFPLDGSKVYAWRRLFWFGATGALLLLGTWVVGPQMVLSFAFLLVFVLVLSKLLFG